MNNQVKVTANKAGQVINVSPNNPEYGYIRVEQKRASFEGGWARTRTLSALISGKVSELKEMGFVAGTVLPGTIHIVEQCEPFNTENPEKDLKIAGDTAIQCTIGGAPIYRKTFFTEDTSVADALVSHDNVDAIKEAYEALKKEEEANL